MKTVQVEALACAGQSLRPAAMTCGSVNRCSSFTILHQRGAVRTAASPSETNTHPHLHTHLCTAHTHSVSIKLIFEQGTGFISETNGMLLTNADFHVSLIHLSCYSG